MFKIYGGDTKFTQWTKNQKLIMSRLPLGAEVLFYNDPKEDEPLVTEVYEYTDENGISFHVCDVPNIFLTDTKRIKVRIPSKVVGLYGIVHSYVGQPERYFEVEPAEKPADYVYEETPTEGCGGHGGSVSEDQVQADLSQTDNTAPDYVKGVLRAEHLPEGYPYKGIGIILDGTFEFSDGDGGIYSHQITDENFTIVDGKSYTIIWDGEAYQCVATTFKDMFVVFGNLAIAGAGADTGEPFLFIIFDTDKVVYTTDTAATHTITVRGEIAYPIASEFLPLDSTPTTDSANPVTSGGVKNALDGKVSLAVINARMPDIGDWCSVTYGSGKFVAVAGNSSQAAYSEDGINWAQSTMPSTANWKSVTYGNGKFVAIEYNSKRAAYSEDGINWTASTMPSSAFWQSVTYGNGKFVAIVFYSKQAAYSEDGINWTQSTMPSTANWKSVTYGNGKFVAVAYISDKEGYSEDDNKSAYSEDGITWKNTFEYISQNNSDITESVRSVINKSIYETIVGVPACTAADNGKVLKVVDGVPTWVEA